jgi:hypothetical protein
MVVHTNNFFEQIFRKEWGITTEQLERLKNRCNLPKGIDYKVEGLYSWNKKQPNWNNCSSIKIVYNVMKAKKHCKDMSASESRGEFK